jgi:hypothetical protein
MRPKRRAPRYHFNATAEAVGSSDLRPARVETLSILGVFFAMPDPFDKDASILVKIRTKTDSSNPTQGSHIPIKEMGWESNS